jgi:CHAT domain-containing protein/cytochrome c-type biogenesis protein CcmH/NrfG
MEDLARDPAPEEEAVLARLESSKPEWQKQLAVTLSPKKAAPAPWLPGTFRRVLEWTRPRFIPVLAGVAVLVALGIGAARLATYLNPQPPTRLLAEAYSQERTLELRFPNAQYAPLRQERGAATSTLNRPAVLLKAGAAIQEGLAKHPDDPVWLDAKARFDLLDRNYEEAIRSLNRALEARPDSPTLLADLAIAYFERAERENRPLDYGNAIELLGKALARGPDDPVALFNRALAYERMFMVEQAIEDWQHYLRVDPRGGWAAEAERHLKDLEEKKKSHAPGAGVLLTDPAGFVPFAEGRRRVSRASATQEIDSRIEDYLDVAIKQWLPAAYPVGPGERSSLTNARSALRILATIAKRRHGDQWLTDMLAARPSPEFAEAVGALGGAVTADQAGDPDAAQGEAKQAEHRFTEAGDQAGELRSELEEVYALQRMAAGDRCEAAARRLSGRLGGRGYVWMEGQLLLEESICSDIVGDLGEALTKAGRALDFSQATRYGTLYLRSLGMAATMNTDVGNSVAAWSLNQNGLREYWSGEYPFMRAYQFYSDLVSTAEELGRWQLALALNREAVKMIVMTSNRSGEAVARYRLATAASLAGATGEAVEEFLRAEQLFAGLPQNQVTRTYRAEAEISLARLESQEGRGSDALARLERLRPDLREASDYLMPLDFYSTLGRAHLQRREYDQAKKALQSAARIIETAIKVPSADDRLAWSQEVGGVYRDLVEIGTRAHDNSLGALEIWEWYRGLPLWLAKAPAGGSRSPDVPAADFARLDAGPPLPAMDQVQRALPSLDRETVVSYAQLSQGIAIWVFDNRGVRSEWVPVSGQALERLVRRFAAECADPSSDLTVLHQEGRQLYQWLIAPIERRLEGRRTMVIEPDGAIASVPMQTLEDSAGRYLGSRFTMVSSPGIAYWRRLRCDTPLKESERALVVGAPAISRAIARYFPPLPDAAREARAVTSRFRGVKELTGEQATIEAVRQELSTAVVFHFAGHAFASASRSGLLLAPSAAHQGEGAEILGGRDVTPAVVPQLKLAVLSACSTGSGDQESFVDPESLVRRFLLAGVPHVVASRWNVDSATAAEFMDAFYSRLLAGSSVPGALQAAGEKIRSNPVTSRPYYWAVFSSFGAGLTGIRNGIKDQYQRSKGGN